MSVLRDAGLRVPDDVAIVGFDDIPPAALTAPGLTTMAMPMSELGRTAARIIGQQIDGTIVESVRQTFDPRLVVRHSSRRPHV